MKKMYRTILAVALLFGAMSLNAQNVCTIGKGTGHSLTIESSKNVVLEQKSDNIIMGHSVKEINTSIKAGAEVFHLTIKPEGIWEEISVYSDNNGYYKYVHSYNSPEGFSEEVEEGEYEVYVLGNAGKSDWFRSTYMISVDHDMVFEPAADADATNQITIEGVDENGVSLSEKNISLMLYDGVFHSSGIDDFFFQLCGDSYVDKLECFRFNELTDNDKISIYAPIETEGQIAYLVEYSAILGGANNTGWTITNQAEDFDIFKEYFAVTEGNQPYYYNVFTEYLAGENYMNGVAYTASYGFDGNLTYNPNEPLTIITNIDVREPDVYVDGEVKAKISPLVYQNAPEDDLEDKVISSNVFFKDNQMVMQPFGEFFSTLWYPHNNTPFYFEETPVASYYTEKKNFAIGERTPIAYFQSRNYNENNSPYGYSYCSGEFLFLGENGCQRYGDEASMMRVEMNGEVVFDDNLFNFNMMDGYFEPETPCAVHIDIANKHLVYNGVDKYNNTVVDYDLNRNDAMPPTLTILQIMDEENTESIYLSNYASSHINFAAGDFKDHQNEMYGFIDHMQYVGKPNVEVYYTIGNNEWNPLECAEDESMFHPNYGNFFTIDLSQIENLPTDHWVDMKFIVTDEAGNSQKQILNNLFYTGTNVSISEQTNTLTSTVYPNPFTNEIRINAAEAVNGSASISVFNVLGEQVISKAMNCNETTEFVIDGSSLNAGIYFYSISTENGELKGRIVKE